MAVLLTGSKGETMCATRNIVRIDKDKAATARYIKTIQIQYIDSVEVRENCVTLTGSNLDLAPEEYSVAFSGQDEYQTALKIKAYVDSWHSREQVAYPYDTTRLFTPREIPSPDDEMAQLKAQLDKGEITYRKFRERKWMFFRFWS